MIGFNWRKPLILTGLRLTGSDIPNGLREAKYVSELSQEEIDEYQNDKLKSLLDHAYKNVPYYRRVFEENNIVEDGEIQLDRFDQIPLLTKEKIRNNYSDLHADDISRRDHFENRTGGSTGKPLTFVQDKQYKDKNYANKIFYCSLVGKDIGETEMKIWGADRDISENLKSKLIYFLYNRTFENSFMLNENRCNEIIRSIRQERPKLIWGYVNSLNTLSQYMEKTGENIPSPTAVFSAAGTLTSEIRNSIHNAFDAPVHNVYGSREMGDFAFEEVPGEGLSIFQHSHRVEVIGNNGGEYGNIIVTSLNNYSMPLIRYDIGDLSEGIIETNSGSTNFLKLKNVVGRKTSVFETRDGTIIPPEFFIHMVGVEYNNGFIDRFRVIQKEYDYVVVQIKLNGEKDENMLEKIKKSIKERMGDDCTIEYRFVDEISLTDSGKFRYTESEVRS